MRERRVRSGLVHRVVRGVTLSFLGALMSFTVATGQEAPALRFDVASVKPRAMDIATPLSFDIRDDGMTAINYPLSGLIAYAYGITEARLEKLPAWARTERFDIRA